MQLSKLPGQRFCLMPRTLLEHTSTASMAAFIYFLAMPDQLVAWVVPLRWLR